MYIRWLINLESQLSEIFFLMFNEYFDMDTTTKARVYYSMALQTVSIQPIFQEAFLNAWKKAQHQPSSMKQQKWVQQILNANAYQLVPSYKLAVDRDLYHLNHLRKFCTTRWKSFSIHWQHFVSKRMPGVSKTISLWPGPPNDIK